MRVLMLAALAALSSFAAQPSRPEGPPNIVFILADDLGYGELGSYGQQRIRTPRLDRLAAEGMRFTQYYAGSTVCAPSRAVFLTGLHTGHAYVRDNYGTGTHADDDEQGQFPLPPDHPTLARALQARGYATAAIGKWGLGGPGSTGVPNKQGFDFFFGYLDQRQAHNYYPTHLWKNAERFPLRNPWFSPHQKHDGDPNDPASYAKYSGVDYSIDFMTKEAVDWVRANASRPFFLYFAPTIPHLALQVPDAALKEYEGKFPETPYLGDRQYLPNRTPRATYAAMITYLDTHVGRILDALKDAGVDDRTLVVFTSDNGAIPSISPAEFFDSNKPLRGQKTNLYEGGIRVPMIARWPGRIRAGATSDHVSAHWDMWATFSELTGAPAPAVTDGLSIVPTLLGRDGQRRHDALYWENHARGGMQAVRMGRWKGIRQQITKQPNAPIELYDLERDISESTNVAGAHPDIVRRVETLMKTSRTPAVLPRWNFGQRP